jgi:hypothetical protein
MNGIDGSPKHSMAYAMFQGRKSNYEVAQALSLTEHQTQKFKVDYLKLIGLDPALFHLGVRLVRDHPSNMRPMYNIDCRSNTRYLWCWLLLY